MSRSHLLPELWICHLGTVAYRDAMAMQNDIRARRCAGELPDVVLLLEHPPTYTRGRRSSQDELPLGEEHYRRRGLEVLATDRGGRVTYHGPGQLVGYPIVAVDDIVAHVRGLEVTLIAALADEGIHARSRAAEGPDFTGVWVRERKIASIGVHVSRGVATHGFAINVDNDLEPFSWIVPCGLAGVRMTSLARELSPRFETATVPGTVSRSPLLPRFRSRVSRRFCELHGRRARRVSVLELGIASRVEGAFAAQAPIAAAELPSAQSAAAVLQA